MGNDVALQKFCACTVTQWYIICANEAELPCVEKNTSTKEDDILKIVLEVSSTGRCQCKAVHGQEQFEYALDYVANRAAIYGQQFVG